MFSSVGVLISCRRGSKDGSNCSGIQLCNTGWILTTASLFGELLSEKERRVLCGATQGLKHIPTVSPDMLESTTFCVISQAAATGNIDMTPVEVQQMKTPYVSPRSWVKRKATLEYVWRCPLLTQSVESVLYANTWDLGTSGTSGKPGEEPGNEQMIRMLFSVFVLLRVHNEQEEDWGVKASLQKWYLQLGSAHRGLCVYIESTPFGNPFFLNSWSGGVVSNTAGPSGCLMLTDAHAALGSEGAPMVSIPHISKGKLIGMVLSSLSWWRGEWVGFTLGVSLKPIICNLLHLHQAVPGSVTPDAATPSWTCLVDEAVVLIRSGFGSWGSGVVVDAASGTILTCSHVVNKADDDTVSIYCNGRVIKSVPVVYVNRSNYPYDLAVLRVPGGLLKHQVPLSTDPPKRGDIVWTAGFPLICEKDEPRLKPTLSRGVVSKVLDVHGPAMLHTTCCVQSGMSGGPVLREGRLLGVMACHTHSVDSGARFPHVNMAIPTAAFEKPLLKFLQTSDVGCLQALETKDEEIQQMWKLKVVPSSKL